MLPLLRSVRNADLSLWFVYTPFLAQFTQRVFNACLHVLKTELCFRAHSLMTMMIYVHFHVMLPPIFAFLPGLTLIIRYTVWKLIIINLITITVYFVEERNCFKRDSFSCRPVFRTNRNEYRYAFHKGSRTFSWSPQPTCLFFL